MVYGEDIKSLPVFSLPPAIAFYSDTKISADSQITEFTFDERTEHSTRCWIKAVDTALANGLPPRGGDLVEMDNDRANEGIIKFAVHDDVTSAFTLEFCVLTDGSGREKNCECWLQCNPA